MDTLWIITFTQNRTECLQNESSVQSINCSLLLGRWHNSAVCFFVVECQCDLKLLTAPDAYTALGSCCLSSSIICIDGCSPSACLTVNLYFSSLPSRSSASFTNRRSVLPLYELPQLHLSLFLAFPSLLLSSASISQT